MPDISFRLRHHGRVAILVSRYNELITARLLDGALACCDEAGRPARRGGRRVAARVRSSCPRRRRPRQARGRYACLVALGAVIRGETPHFEYVAGDAATRAHATSRRQHAIPVGFGVLTVDTLQQAMERAGGSAGNKGHEAAAAALGAADAIAQLRASHAQD